VQGLLFRELVRSTAVGREPDLAASLPTLEHGARVAADGTLVVDWVLRADAFWQDGKPVTSNDVVAGFKIAADTSQQVLSGGTLAQQIARIDVVDATHFTVVWKTLQPSFADVRVHRVLPAHLVMNADGSAKNLTRDGFCRRPVGNAAFKLAEWTPGAHLLFVRNDRFSPRPLLDEVLVKIVPSTDSLQSALIAGDVDATFGNGGLAPTEALRAAASGTLTATLAPGTTWVHLDFRLDDPWLKDARVRRALALSVDRKALVQTIAGDAYDVDDSFFPRHHWAHADTAPIVFDPTESARLLDAAGWTLKPGSAIRVNAAGEPLHLELASATGQKRHRASAADDASELGPGRRRRRPRPQALQGLLRGERQEEKAQAHELLLVGRRRELDRHGPLAQRSHPLSGQRLCGPEPAGLAERRGHAPARGGRHDPRSRDEKAEAAARAGGLRRRGAGLVFLFSKDGGGDQTGSDGAVADGDVDAAGLERGAVERHAAVSRGRAWPLERR
jgi:hypothetical protein